MFIWACSQPNQRLRVNSLQYGCLMIDVLHLYVGPDVADAARGTQALAGGQRQYARPADQPLQPLPVRKSSCLTFTDWNQMQFVLIVHNRTPNCFRATALRRGDRRVLLGHQQRARARIDEPADVRRRSSQPLRQQCPWMAWQCYTESIMKWRVMPASALRMASSPIFKEQTHPKWSPKRERTICF